MQPFVAVMALVAALGVVAVNSETAYILQPVPRHNRVQRVLSSSGWGWKPVRTIQVTLPSISRGWGWKKQSQGLQLGIYGGLRIGPKQQGWGWQPQKQPGWGWQPPKQQGWGWQPQKQQGWGWEPPKQQGWGWKQQGWGWGDDDDDEDDYRSTVPAIAYDDVEGAESSEENYDDASDSVESDEEEDDISAEYDSPIDYRNAVAYDPIY